MFLQLLAPFWSKCVSFEDAVPLSTAPVGVQHPPSRAVSGLRNTLVKFCLALCCRVPVCSGKVWHRGFLPKKPISVEKETCFLLKNRVTKKTRGRSKRETGSVRRCVVPCPPGTAGLALCAGRAPSTQLVLLPFSAVLFPLSRFQDVWPRKRG